MREIFELINEYPWTTFFIMFWILMIMRFLRKD